MPNAWLLLLWSLWKLLGWLLSLLLAVGLLLVLLLLLDMQLDLLLLQWGFTVWDTPFVVRSCESSVGITELAFVVVALAAAFHRSDGESSFAPSSGSGG